MLFVKYEANRSAWMTSELRETELQDFIKFHRKIGR